MLTRCASLTSHARTFRVPIVAVALLACGDSSSNPTAPPNPGGVAQISITPSAPSITLGAQLALQAQVRDASGNLITGASVFWSSADTNVVTVSSTGIVTGKSVGSAQVAASSGGQSARAVVTVLTAPVATISVIPSNATIVVGGTTVLRAVTYDAGGQVLTGRSVAWASSSTQIASVDTTGTVIGVSAGTATLTATSEGKTASAAITVTVIPIASIGIVPGSAALVVGQSTSLTAIPTDAHGNVLGGRPMTWTSADTTIAQVSTLGLVTAIGPGTTTIRATAEGKSGVAQVVVTAATPTPVGSVVVSPPTASIVIGGTATLSATVRDANGAILSGRVVTWSSSTPQVATVSGSGVVTAVAPGSATITATSEGKSGSSAITVSAVPVASVVVTPTSASLLVGATTTISVVTSDANGIVLTGRVVTWASNAPSIATVSASGVVTAVSAGTATITATSEGISASAAVTVSLAPVATVTLNPTTASLVVGSATTIAAVLKDATGIVLAGRVVTWMSNTPGVATVDASGTVTAVSAGNTIITATSEGKSATATITVSLIPVASVVTSPTSANLFIGGATTITAITKDASGNILGGRIVTWTSSAPLIATVSMNGLVTAIAAGTATITATSEGVSSSGASVVVTPVPVATVSVTPPAPSIPVYQTIQLFATTKDGSGTTLTGRVVTWSTSDAFVATVDASGLVTAIKTGTATITATSEGKTGIASLTVTPAPVAAVSLSPTSANLQVPASTTITATTTDAHGLTLTGRTVTWSSSTPSIATVDALSGLITAVERGTATITATSEGKSASITVTVTNPVASVVVSPSNPSIAVYQTVPLSATTKNASGTTLTGRTVAWSTNNPSIATVDALSGLVTAVAAGTTTITATSEGQTGTATVTVTPAPVATVVVSPSTASVQVGATATFSAATFDSHSSQLTGRIVTWSSNPQSVATVDASGIVTAVAPGSATITATSEGKSGTATVTVVPVPVASVTLNPTSANLQVGASTTITATTLDANNTVLTGRIITWASDAPSIATVNSSGLVTAIAAGTAHITATSEGKSATATVTVTPVPVASVVVTPTSASLSAAVAQQVTLTASPRDSNNNPLGGRVIVWSSDTPSVATVDPNTGVVTAVAPGTAIISATCEGIVGTATITVTP